MTGSFFFQGSGAWFKFHSEVTLSSGKSGSSGAEINTLVNVHILLWIKTVLFQDIFKYHFRHAAGAPAQNILTL